MNIASKIDHTLLKPSCLETDIVKLCKEAADYNFFSVCIPPFYVPVAKNLLNKSSVKVCTVIGFPLGYDTMDTKARACEEALLTGADEIDMVINITAFKSGKHNYVFEEIKRLAVLSHQSKVLLKVIIETAYLSSEEMKVAASIAADAGADFVKTSTGFADKGATTEDIILLRKILPSKVKIKASGGIRTYWDALNFINCGADRLGTSNGINIINNAKTVPEEPGKEKNY